MKKTIASLALFALSGAASAFTITPSYTLQSSTDFIVNETFNSSTGTGYYDITNNLGSEVIFFAVSALNATDAETTRLDPLSSKFGSQTVTEDEWSFKTLANSDLSYEASFGSFDSVFGTEDNVANIYYRLSGTGILNGETTGNQFSYSALVPASNWVAVTDNFSFTAYTGSATVPTSSPSAVPVPAAALLFAPALVGFAALRRKAKKAA